MLSLLLHLSCWIGLSFAALDKSKVDKLELYFKGKRDETLTKNKNKLSKNKDIITSFKPKKYVINLEDSLEVRWGALCREYGHNVVTFYNYFNYVLTEIGIADDFYAFVTEWFKSVPEPYKEEITFFSECTETPLAGAITLNLLEIFLVFGCTSIIGVNDDDIIYHGRNLDVWLGALQSVSESMIITVEYKFQGETLFEGTTPFGFAGITQGVKPSQFSISVNIRYSSTLFESLAALEQGYYPYAWLIRDTLTNSANYQVALTQLQSTRIIAPCYLSIAGLSYPDGAIISRDFTQTADLATLGSSDFGWFIAVTNHDWWSDLGILDEQVTASVERRDTAIQNMNTLTKADLNGFSMFNIMSQVPTINFGTLTTSVFSASRSGINMHNVKVVRLTMSDTSQLFVYPSNYSNWTAIFVVILLISVSFNMAMCIKLLFCGKSKARYYSKVPQELMKVMEQDLDDDTEEEQI